MIYNKKNREVIFQKMVKGDETSYQSVYYYFYESLCVYILNYTSNRALAEDIAQESLLKLWIKRETLKSASSLRSFLFRTAYHKFIDYCRNEKKINEELENFRRESLNELLDDNSEFKSKLERIRQGIESLPPKCKEIFILSKKQGLSYNEIATRLDITPKTVENQIGKAFKLLREKVKNEMVTIMIFIQKRIFRMNY